VRGLKIDVAYLRFSKIQPTFFVFWSANSVFLRFRFACTNMYIYASGSRKTLFSPQNTSNVDCIYEKNAYRF